MTITVLDEDRRLADALIGFEHLSHGCLVKCYRELAAFSYAQQRECNKIVAPEVPLSEPESGFDSDLLTAEEIELLRPGRCSLLESMLSGGALSLPFEVALTLCNLRRALKKAGLSR